MASDGVAGVTGTALWIVAPGAAELRSEEVAAGPGEVLVETPFSGISRGTEALVLRGGVPRAERARMRAPLQAGSFPVSGEVRLCRGRAGGRRGRRSSRGATSSCCIRTRTGSRRRRRWRCRCRTGVPAGRAVLAANMETALNIVWDAGAGARRPDRGGRRRRGRGAGRLALRPAAGGRGDAGRRQPGAGGAGGGARLRLRRAGGGAGGLRPRDPRQRQRRGAGDGAGGGGAGGDGGRGELVRRPAADGGARRRVPQPAAAAGLEPGRPGADRRGGRAGATGGGWRRRCGCWPTRRSTC